MAIDAGIYQAITPRLKSVADFDREAADMEAAQQQRQMRGLEMQAVQQRMADAASQRQRGTQLRSLLSQGAAPQDLRRAGFLEEARDEEKFALDRQRSGLDMQAKQLELLRGSNKMVAEGFRSLLSNPQGSTPQQAIQTIAQMRRSGVFAPLAQMQGVSEDDIAASMVREIPPEPGAFASWLRTNAMQALDFDKTLPQVERLDAGNELITRLRDPISGQVIREERTPKGLTPAQAQPVRVAATGARASGGGASGGAVGAGTDDDPMAGLGAQDRMIVEGLINGSVNPASLSTKNNYRGRMEAIAGRVMRAGGADGDVAQAALRRRFGTPEKGFRWKEDGTQEPIPGGAVAQKMEADQRKREERQAAAARQATAVLGTVEEAKNLAGIGSAGFVGSALAGVPGTSARNLQAKLDTIKANLGFDRLQMMREMSPTGGALGQVAVQELIALQSTVASLDQAQSPTELRKALDKIERHYNAWLETLKGTESAGQQAPQTNAPPADRLKEGVVTTFSNGQAWTLRNGQPQRVR